MKVVLLAILILVVSCIIITQASNIMSNSVIDQIWEFEYLTY